MKIQKYTTKSVREIEIDSNKKSQYVSVAKNLYVFLYQCDDGSVTKTYRVRKKQGNNTKQLANLGSVYSIGYVEAVKQTEAIVKEFEIANPKVKPMTLVDCYEKFISQKKSQDRKQSTMENYDRWVAPLHI